MSAGADCVVTSPFPATSTGTTIRALQWIFLT